MEDRRAVTLMCPRWRPTCSEMLGHTNWSALGLLPLLVCPATEGLQPRLSGLERVLLRRGGNLTGLLALLAPLAALPLIAGTALPLSMAPLLAPAMSTVLGRRRRRDLLATFIGKNEEQQQDEVLAGYLQCSGMLAADNHCLERLACQFSADALRGPLHKDVASLVIYTLLRNQFIPERFKQRLRSAAHQARSSDCRRRFPCTQQRP
ncbi:uncharacterized protein LOC119388299 [Rhipicephalus sanguineus]|uniref:uncharacterized protein LOC119388299 n=1 Tax=Rhipicephalus sanguineus TaxID=34632 RepID=UPI001895670E|nr:uncharacterized protein LOC119388299 [Rhipicephalus sanguineus]